MPSDVQQDYRSYLAQLDSMVVREGGRQPWAVQGLQVQGKESGGKHMLSSRVKVAGIVVGTMWLVLWAITKHPRLAGRMLDLCSAEPELLTCFPCPQYPPLNCSPARATPSTPEASSCPVCPDKAPCLPQTPCPPCQANPTHGSPSPSCAACPPCPEVSLAHEPLSVVNVACPTCSLGPETSPCSEPRLCPSCPEVAEQDCPESTCPGPYTSPRLLAILANGSTSETDSAALLGFMVDGHAPLRQLCAMLPTDDEPRLQTRATMCRGTITLPTFQKGGYLQASFTKEETRVEGQVESAGTGWSGIVCPESGPGNGQRPRRGKWRRAPRKWW